MLSFRLRRFWQKSVNVASKMLPPIDLVENWRWIRAEPFGPSQEDAVPRTLNWFIPPFGRGSGGHLNIFRFVNNLEAAGFKCRIIICDDGQPLPNAVSKARICEWFFPINAEVYYHPQQLVPPASISIATGWQTAYRVKAFRGTRHRCYFVQDYEPWFYSRGSEALFAEETYRFGFVGITAGDWLAEKLRDEFGMTTHAVGFSYDRELYCRVPKRDDVPRIFFYARPPTARRAFELGLIVLAEFAKRHPEVGICLAGWDLGTYHIPFPALTAGLLPLDELPDLYSQCDAALILSLTNASLLPLEIMACGCVVVSNRGPNVEWLLDDQTAVLVNTDVESVVEGLEKAVYDKPLRRRVAENASRMVSMTNWSREAEKMAAVFTALDK